jgi:hypothetical protein
MSSHDEIDPIPTWIKGSDVPLTPLSKEPRPLTTTTHTYQSAIGGAEAILNTAPNRVMAVISVLGVVGTASNIILATTAGEGQTSTGEGSGAVLQPGQQVRHLGQDSLFLSAMPTGVAALVSVIQVFKRS